MDWKAHSPTSQSTVRCQPCSHAEIASLRRCGARRIYSVSRLGSKNWPSLPQRHLTKPAWKESRLVSMWVASTMNRMGCQKTPQKNSNSCSKGMSLGAALRESSCKSETTGIYKPLLLANELTSYASSSLTLIGKLSVQLKLLAKPSQDDIIRTTTQTLI